MLSSPIVQIAYFVTDIRLAAEKMTRTLGAGPFFIAENIELAWGEHRGESCKFLHSSAFGQCGDIMMELVQQDREGPSPFRDMYAAGQEGIHHVATIVDSVADSCRHFAEQGFPTATRAETLTGIQFTFIDTVPVLGHMLEVYEGSEPMQDLYAMVREASRDWDGTGVIRPLT
jgi:hypothetical protein